MSSDEEVQDTDSCGYGEILSQFTKWSIVDEKHISEKSSYVLHITADKSFSKSAAGTSLGSVKIYTISPAELVATSELSVGFDSKQSISGVEFAKDNVNLLYIGTSEGRIRVFDLRKNENVYSFEEELHEKKIPISCLDVNSNGMIICAGSEKLYNDAFLIFFDTRQRKSLGTYFESHEDDVTSVKFHPTHPDYLISGSTDGLINVFDISKTSEDDALSTVVNSESSIQKLQWHKKDNDKYDFSCVTHTDDFKLYDSEEGDLVHEFPRAEVSEAIRRKSSDFCNIVNCHSRNDGSIFLLAGSNYKDNILRSVFINTDVLQPFGNHENNKQIVRDSVCNENANIMLTAGENAVVNMWHEIPIPVNQEHLKVKSKKSSKSHNKKPY